MKKLTLLLILGVLLTSCDKRPYDEVEALTVYRIEEQSKPYRFIDREYKYKIELRETDVYLYTNKKYNVNDTLR